MILKLSVFNLGIEVGQIFVVVLFMVGRWLSSKVLTGEHSKWNQFVLGAGFGIAAILLIEALSRPEAPPAGALPF